MTHLSWTRSKDKTSPLFISQINGLTLLCLVGIVIYFAAAYAQRHQGSAPPVDDAQRHQSTAAPIYTTEAFIGAVAVEVSGETKRRGIYYLPPGTQLTTFLESLNISPKPALPSGLEGTVLKSGTTIIVNRDHRIEIGGMTASTRLSLGLPLNINKASMEDLILIPGIKEATAGKILAFRKAAGGRINRMEDLMQISGIKEKRLQKFKRYLFVTGVPAKRSDHPDQKSVLQ